MIRTFSITQTSEGACDSTWFFLMPSSRATLSCTAREVDIAIGITHGITKGIAKGCAKGIARRAPIKESPYQGEPLSRRAPIKRPVTTGLGADVPLS